MQQYFDRHVAVQCIVQPTSCLLGQRQFFVKHDCGDWLAENLGQVHEYLQQNALNSGINQSH